MSTDTDALAAAVQSLTEAMRATASDPIDAIQMLSTFLATPLPVILQPDEADAQATTASLFRRSALMSIALACADYQPASSTEADAMIANVGLLLDAEMTIAADNGEESSFEALRDLRGAVIADLTARSASLPELVTVNLPGNLPSLVMAYRLYADTTREPRMVARVNVSHPGFMPNSFEALSS